MKPHWAMTNSKCVVCNGWHGCGSEVAHAYHWHLPMAKVEGIWEMTCWCGKVIRSEGYLLSHLAEIAGISPIDLRVAELIMENHYLECLMGVEK